LYRKNNTIRIFLAADYVEVMHLSIVCPTIPLEQWVYRERWKFDQAKLQMPYHLGRSMINFLLSFVSVRRLCGDLIKQKTKFPNSQIPTLPHPLPRDIAGAETIDRCMIKL